MNTELWLLTGLIVASAFLLLVFTFASNKMQNRTINYFDVMPIGYSHGIVDIDNKEVYIRGVKGSDSSLLYTIELDEFIYSISINNDSKLFREMLKEINNGVSKDKIKKKLAMIEGRFVAILKGEDGYETISIFELNPNQEFENQINFQTVNARLDKKKSNLTKDFIEDPIKTLSETQTFAFLNKEAKKFSTKGVTLIKVQPKVPIVSTKGELINHLSLLTIRQELKMMGVQSVISKLGNLYGVVQNEKNRTQNTIGRLWENKFNATLSKNVSNEYINAKTSDYEVYATMSQGKDSSSVNVALIELNLISNEGIKINNKNRNEISSRANLINREGDTISKELKEKKPPIRNTSDEIVERGYRNLVEFYIDYPDNITNLINEYSFKHQKDILEVLIREANKYAAKEPKDIVSVTIPNKTIDELSIAIKNISLKSNFYIMIQEAGFEEYRSREIGNITEELKSMKLNIIQFIADENSCDVNLFRTLKPNIVLVNRGVVSKTPLSHPFTGRFKTIEEFKTKDTKILNLK